MRKYKRFKSHKTRASCYLQRCVLNKPKLFAHWASAAAGGALNVFGACFIGQCILVLPFTLALTWASQKISNANHPAQKMFWLALTASLCGALLPGSAAIGSGILGVATIYEVATCRLSGTIALQLVAKI